MKTDVFESVRSQKILSIIKDTALPHCFHKMTFYLLLLLEIATINTSEGDGDRFCDRNQLHKNIEKQSVCNQKESSSPQHFTQNSTQDEAVDFNQHNGYAYISWNYYWAD